MSVHAKLNIPSDKVLPKHIAIIMDGNNRWAKARRLPSLAGHKAGVDSVRSVIEGCVEYGVQSLTLFAFSSENWKRPELEVKGLMELFGLALSREGKKLHKNNIRLNVIGDKTRFSKTLQSKIAKIEELTADNTLMTLNVAANYGGQWDIVQAAKRLAAECVSGSRQPEDITESVFDEYVLLHDQSNPDLCIRTGGESRISNFLVWQMAYTEYYFVDDYWPDFNKVSLAAAIRDFCTRERRFGKTSEQLGTKTSA
ncbi:polyprenyl diphosphate synthase [Neptunomonas antarctica]|uniref:Ditrans,polycis-undecaprenyl-diphosphate synthase ((2E,6E)-farnesyl-diphosphate specific) n=1 Tax=Neptunomonas antarctica TaxID=619304 RepID=A0A1N7J909_9GAMM|nr:polyprenyl diphosphate synthase [Neptunomonas antarctica]SIS45833.1 Undecaprenyl pyrophosphate synthetase [Neptunomonas antarctica]